MASSTITRVPAMAALEKGKPFERWEYELKPEGKKDALIKVIANGICATDQHMWNNDWGMAKYPLVPGHEIVGEVVSVGSEVTDLPIGTVVGLGCIAQSCEACTFCVDRQLDNFCAHTKFTYFHELTDETGTFQHRGGFSSYIRTPASKLLRIPAGLSAEETGPLMCAGSTVFTPLYEWTNKSCDARGKSVGVLGLGGLGHLGVQYAAKMGADEVVVLSRTHDKEALARELGATKYVATQSEDEMKEAANSIDFLLVCISGGKFDANQFFPLMRPYGVIHIVGIPDDSLNFSVMGPFLVKRLTITSSPVGSTEQAKEMLQFSAKHGAKPIIEVFPHSKANEAIQKVVDGSIRFRAVLKNDLLD